MLFAVLIVSFINFFSNKKTNYKVKEIELKKLSLEINNMNYKELFKKWNELIDEKYKPDIYEEDLIEIVLDAMIIICKEEISDLDANIKRIKLYIRGNKGNMFYSDYEDLIRKTKELELKKIIWKLNSDQFKIEKTKRKREIK